MLQVREDAVQSVLEEAEAKLQGFSQDKAKYETMLQDLLVQALAKLKQPATKVKGRKCDADLVKVPTPPRASARPAPPLDPFAYFRKLLCGAGSGHARLVQGGTFTSSECLRPRGEFWPC